MNPIILYMADGKSFFIGLALAGLGVACLLRFQARFVRPVSTIAVLVGMALVLISSTPQPLWSYILWFASAGVCLLVGNSNKAPRKLRTNSAILMLLLTCGLLWAEAAYLRRPKVAIPAGKTVYVLGDSLSAGMGTDDRCWPAVLAQISGLPVVNLAEPGATVQSALRQAERVAEPGSIVIVEIGGNDLLGGTEAAVFRARLDTLIAKLRSDQDTIVMLELPLFPFKNAYGAAQREVAARYGVTLVPKRFLTRVLGLKDATLDGLHLSQKGHDALAAEMAGILKDHFILKGPDASAFGMPPAWDVADMLRADMADARTAWIAKAATPAERKTRDESGFLLATTEAGVADFHALRHTFGSNLARAGVAPKIAMDLMRHSDVNLTMRLYSHTLVADRGDALHVLPDPNAVPAELTQQRATCAAGGASSDLTSSAGQSGPNAGRRAGTSAKSGKGRVGRSAWRSVSAGTSASKRGVSPTRVVSPAGTHSAASMSPETIQKTPDNMGETDTAGHRAASSGTEESETRPARFERATYGLGNR
jgi:acyl-CoA thioesterase I